LIHDEKPSVLFLENCRATEQSETIACTRSCGHPGEQGGGHKKNNKKWRAKEEERRKASPTPQKII
jgi:hypothetical protein